MESKCILLPVEKYNLYPFLGIHNTTIVLFTSKNTGIVVFTKDYYETGFYSTHWNGENFKHYSGKVELSN